MVLIVTTLIIIPFFVFFIALLNEFVFAYESFQVQLASGEFEKNFYFPESPFLQEVSDQFSRFLGVEGLNLTLLISSLLNRVAQYLTEHYASILGGIGVFFLKFSIMIFSMFFFFRDGEALVRELKKLIPLAPEHEDLVLKKLKEVTFATFFWDFCHWNLSGHRRRFDLLFLGNQQFNSVGNGYGHHVCGSCTGNGYRMGSHKSLPGLQWSGDEGRHSVRPWSDGHRAAGQLNSSTHH